MFTGIQYRILKKISARNLSSGGGGDYQGKSKLDVLMGSELTGKIKGKTVIDFGCGDGAEAVEMARKGARRVIGIDIRDDLLQRGAQRAFQAGLEHVCLFVPSTQERAEVIVSIDAFEHFADPAAILRIMDTLLRPTGEVLVSFGPTWYHPRGGHTFSVFPWSHLLFSEEAQIRWRSDFKTDGATRFSEVTGGLNQMTTRRFENLIGQSPFRIATLELVPIRKLQPFHNRLTREFTTAIVRCRLVKRDSSGETS